VSQQLNIDQLLVLWDDGERRLRAAEPRARQLMEQIIEAIVPELRRRLGGPFYSAELGRLYMEGTDWCFDIAMKVAPSTPEAWDMAAIVGAGFSRYVRRARDYGGGRRRIGDDEAE
jgi:hypothetical protein